MVVYQNMFKENTSNKNRNAHQMYNLNNKIPIHIMQGMQIIFFLLTNKSNQSINVPFASVTNNYTRKYHYMFVNNMIFKLMRIVDSK